MYENVRRRSASVLNGFESAGIKVEVKKSNEVFERIENPFFLPLEMIRTNLKPVILLVFKVV